MYKIYYTIKVPTLKLRLSKLIDGEQVGINLFGVNIFKDQFSSLIIFH